MDIRRIARGATASLAFVAFLPFEAAAQLVPPPCELCTTTRIAWESQRDGNSEIYLAAPDGSGARRLTNHAARDESPTISPDGRRVAFSSDRTGAVALHVVGIDGTGLVRVPAAVEHAFAPSWSPDGTMLAFTGYNAGNSDIYVVRLDGTGLRRLTTSPADDTGAAWSPDGILVAFHSNRSGDYEIYTVNVLTGEERRLTNHPETDAYPAWSPDGRSIAFASTRAGPFEWNLYVMNADGSGVTQLTSGPEIDAEPAWSPDGSQIAFSRFPSVSANTPDIFRIGRDGTGLARVTQSGSDRGASWGRLFVAGSNVTQTATTVLLKYRDIGWQASAPLSATGADHWIEGELSTGASQQSFRVGRMGDSTVIDGAPAANYDLRLLYGPDTRREFMHAPVPVVANTASTVVVDVSSAMGILKGTVTVNGIAPGEGLTMCFQRNSEYGWCTELPESGQFSVLLPRGPGDGFICSSESFSHGACLAPKAATRPSATAPPLYRAFAYSLDAQRTTVLPPIAFKAPLAQVELRYKDGGASGLPQPLSATGAFHWIEGDFATARLELGRIEDEVLVDGLVPGTHELRLAYGTPKRSSPPPEFIQRTPVPIVADTTTTTSIDVSRSMGILKGTVTLNGAAPGERLVLCVDGRQTPYHLCTDLAPAGDFSLLLPFQQGDGAICSTEIVTADGCPSTAKKASRRPPPPNGLLRTFAFNVRAGAVTTMPPIAFMAPIAKIELTYRDRNWSSAVPISATGSSSWIEGDMLRSGTSLLALDMGRLADSNVIDTLAAGEYGGIL